MSKVISALRLIGRSTCSAIAGVAGISNAEAIKELIALQEKGLVQQLNGYWWISGRCDSKPSKNNKVVRVRVRKPEKWES